MYIYLINSKKYNSSYLSTACQHNMIIMTAVHDTYRENEKNTLYNLNVFNILTQFKILLYKIIR